MSTKTFEYSRFDRFMMHPITGYALLGITAIGAFVAIMAMFEAQGRAEQARIEAVVERVLAEHGIE